MEISGIPCLDGAKGGFKETQLDLCHPDVVWGRMPQ